MRILISDYGLKISMNQENLIHLANCLLVLAEENGVESITKLLAYSPTGICHVDFVREEGGNIDNHNHSSTR